MQNIQKTIISQYANSPTLTGLIDYFNAELDQTTNFNNFLESIWDVTTCNDFGLAIWARIVNLSKFIYYPTTGFFFGFQTSDNAWQPFNSAPMSSGDTNQYVGMEVDTPTFRKMVIAKSMANIMPATIPNVNTILRYLFSDNGAAFITKSGTMSRSVILGFTPTNLQKYIILYSNVLPRPAGVDYNILVNTNKTTFGQNYDFSTTNTTFGNALV